MSHFFRPYQTLRGHEGYLVAAVISEEKEFTDELKRLSNSFGIGVIHLDVDEPENCEVLIPAREQEYLDWETINRLAINPDFKEFLKRVKIDIESREIRKEWYDKIWTREELIHLFNAKRKS